MRHLKMTLSSLVITIFSLGCLSAGAINSLSTVPAMALQSQSDACSGLNQLDSSQGCGSGKGQVESTVKVIINVLSFIVGMVSVIMVVVSGFKYITSGGSAEKVGSAKNTLIYALVGIVIVALAQLIVNFALGKAAGA